MGKFKRGNPVIFLIIFFTAVGFGVWGMLTPPPGEIANSVLILIAQFLVLSAGIYGYEVHFDLKQGQFHVGQKDEDKEDTENPEGEETINN